jgi:hypothetical protein
LLWQSRLKTFLCFEAAAPDPGRRFALSFH